MTVFCVEEALIAAADAAEVAATESAVEVEQPEFVQARLEAKAREVLARGKR